MERELSSHAPSNRRGLHPSGSSWKRNVVLRNVTTLLDIHVVKRGLYAGFNPVVAMSAKVIVVIGVLILVLMPAFSGQALETLKDITLAAFAGWYIYLMALILFACLVLVCLPLSGRVRLGPDGVAPHHSTVAWLAMLICAGIGVSVMTFSVSEPVSHFLTNPETLNGAGASSDRDSIATAMRFTFLHYGLAAWATYAIVGLGLGLACHRYGQPMTMRSGLAPLLGCHLKGPLGHMIDVLAILAIIAGITTSIVLGIEQICAGLAVLSGSAFFADSSGNPPAVALMTALIMTTGVAITSIISGVNRGVKWISQAAALLFFLVLAVFVATGGGFQSAGVFFDGAAAYLSNLVGQSLTLYDPTLSEASSAQRDWQSKWTIFYWAWWIAFAPFVGMFVAKISRGRTLREFILGVVFAPTLLCFVWFAGTGGTALLLELDGTAGGSIFSAEHAFRIFNTVDILLSPSMALVFKGGLVLLILMLVVASSTAAIIAIKSIGAAGSAHAETPFHSVLWAFVIAANAGAVMAVGGVDAIRDVMIISAVPFSIILGLMLVSAVMILSAIGRR